MTLGGALTLDACVDAALSLESIENTTNLMNETVAKRSESSIVSALGEEQSAIVLSLDKEESIMSINDIEPSK